MHTNLFNIGDTVYFLYNNYIKCAKVIRIFYNTECRLYGYKITGYKAIFIENDLFDDWSRVANAYL